ncbi:MAG: DurN family substrate-assisted peptide maturase [Egibacteraceae bacterium]
MDPVDVEQRPEAVWIRHIQGLLVMLACLPKDGKLREAFELALQIDEGPVLSRISPPSDPDSFVGLKEWLESLWAVDGLTADEKELVEWQNSPENMEVALQEIMDVVAKIQPNARKVRMWPAGS